MHRVGVLSASLKPFDNNGLEPDGSRRRSLNCRNKHLKTSILGMFETLLLKHDPDNLRLRSTRPGNLSILVSRSLPLQIAFEICDLIENY